ncbi:MAG: hypothetical protein K6G85_07085 [Eubacterium sp.]|nr:hypothetical protein [Eubacterium sp.]
MEFVQLHPTASVIFDTKDNGFKEKLEMEFKELNPNAVITICHDEEEVKKQLAVWAKEIDEYAYIPNEESYGISEWIKTKDFNEKLREYPYEFSQENELMKLTDIIPLYIGDISEMEIEDNKELFLVEANIRMIYILSNNSSITQDLQVTIEVTCFMEEIYMIENIYEEEVESEQE